jgi:glyceraldehyde-3-phosphate dehydrogenase (NADP+)
MPASERIAILKKTVVFMERDVDVWSNGIATAGIKTISQARKEVHLALKTLQLSAEEASRISGATIPFHAVPRSKDRFECELKFSIGIVVAIAPFNDLLSWILPLQQKIQWF